MSVALNDKYTSIFQGQTQFPHKHKESTDSEIKGQTSTMESNDDKTMESDDSSRRSHAK